MLTNTNSRIVAVNLVPAGNLWLSAAIGAGIFVCATVLTRSLSRRFLRNYFTFSQAKLVSLEEALRQGEGSHIEFKRGLSENEIRDGAVEEELLKSIAAFANSGDGVVFIGVDNAGKITGLKLTLQQRDRLEHKIRQLVRNRIKPTPPMQITFSDVGEVGVVASVAVARGDQPAYLLNGVIYIRYGSSDVQAQPEDLHRLIAEYAF